MHLGGAERDALYVQLVAHDGRDVFGKRVAGKRYGGKRLAHLEPTGVPRGEAGLDRLPGAGHVGFDPRILDRHRFREIGEVHRLAVRKVAVDGVGQERREGGHQPA